MGVRKKEQIIFSYFFSPFFFFDLADGSCAAIQECTDLCRVGGADVACASQAQCIAAGECTDDQVRRGGRRKQEEEEEERKKRKNKRKRKRTNKWRKRKSKKRKEEEEGRREEA